ncbi:MAG: D-alanyl-D-alanine carboxypeptidase family protein [Rhizobiales bacterium]|nr:D-alanyl-D-alanine carboxypeptidase family protein [Hyphomicrobiales bacterium]
MRVPEYTPDVSLRPAFRQGIDVHASPESFGAATGRGMTQLAAGLSNAADSFAKVQALEDETAARSKRNEFIRAKDDLLYGENGYLGKDGQAAIDGFSDYQRGLDDLRRKYAADLTPAQQQLFTRAVEPLQNDALRSGLTHKSKALKSVVVESATNGADNFKNEAVRNYSDPVRWQKYTAAGLAEIQGLGEKLGWPAEKLKAEQQTYLSDAHKLTALQIANDDPVAALEYVSKNRDRMSPVDHLNTMRSLMPMVAPAITRDAVEARDAAPPPAEKERATLGAAATAGATGPTNARTFLVGRLAAGHGRDHIDGLDADFATNLATMMQDAPTAIREGLGILSGFRSVDRQRQLWEKSDKSGKWVAPPGRSLHNHGQAVDLSWKGQSLARAPQEVLDWVHQNAGRYGIYFPMSYEPWHAEPVGSRGGKRSASPAARIMPEQIGDTTQSVTASSPRAQFATQFFVDRGYTQAQAAGIVGNLIAESGLRADASHDSNTGIGIAGHRNERADALRKFAAARNKPATDFQTQLEFIADELDTSEASVKAALSRAKTPQEAAEAFIAYERPRGYAAGGDARSVSGYKPRIDAANEAAGNGATAAPRGVTVAGVRFSPRVEKLLSDLPANYANRIREAAASGVAHADAQEAAQVKAQQIVVSDNYRLRIASGDTSLTRNDILEDPVLDEGRKADLLNSYTSKVGDTLKTQQAIGAFQAGQFAIDPYSSDGKKLVDSVWTALSSTVEKDRLPATLEDLVRQASVVPQPVMNAIRGGLVSGSPASVADAAAFAARLNTIDPAALERRDGGKEIRDAAVMFSRMTGALGLTPTTAAQQLIDARNPDKARERAALMESEPVKKFVKDQAAESNVRDIYDPGLFGFDPKLGETPAQSAAAVAEYKDILEQSIVDAAGNQDVAKALAADRFKRRYGVTEFAVSGKNVVTRLPPEVAYPVGADGTHNYIRRQAKDALNTAGVSSRDIYLVADAMTERDVVAGKPARYQLFYRTKDGVLERYRLPFYAVPPTKDEIAAERRARSETRRTANPRFEAAAGDRDRDLDRMVFRSLFNVPSTGE